MGRSGRTVGQYSEQVNQGGRIYYSEALISSLENSLKASFKRPDLRLTRRPSAKQGGPLSIMLADGDRLAEENATTHRVFAILTDQIHHDTFYFGFTALFDPWTQMKTARQHWMYHISLSIFQNLIGDLVPVFRAEWDERGVSTTSDHAQPHWHFSLRPDRIEGIVRVFVSPGEQSRVAEFSPDVESELFPDVAELDKFHFAMSPLWVKDKTAPHKHGFESEEQFLKWFDNLTRYVAHQLVYVCAKSPAEQTFDLSSDNL